MKGTQPKHTSWSCNKISQEQGADLRLMLCAFVPKHVRDKPTAGYSCTHTQCLCTFCTCRARSRGGICSIVWKLTAKGLSGLGLMSRSTSSCTMCHTRRPAAWRTYSTTTHSTGTNGRHTCRKSTLWVRTKQAVLSCRCTHLAAVCSAGVNHAPCRLCRCLLSVQIAGALALQASPCDFQSRVVSTSSGASMSSCRASCKERSCGTTAEKGGVA